VTKLAAGVSLVVLVALLAACGGGSGRPKPVYPATINVYGDVQLNGAASVRGNIADCAGAGRYADLVAGAPVTVSNQAGVPLVVGKITYAVGTNVYQNQLDQCTLRYLAWGVPRAASYQITIARQAPIAARFVDLIHSGGVRDVTLPPPAAVTTTRPVVTRPPGA